MSRDNNKQTFLKVISDLVSSGTERQSNSTLYFTEVTSQLAGTIKRVLIRVRHYTNDSFSASDGIVVSRAVQQVGGNSNMQTTIAHFWDAICPGDCSQ
jgi:hypothetical protein